MNKQEICFFNTNKAWGGGEKWVHDFALLSRSQGLNVHVVARTGSPLTERLKKEQLSVHEIDQGNLSFLNPLHISALTRHFQAIRPKAVIFSLPADLKAGGIAARRAGIPVRIYRRGIALPVKNTVLNRYLYSKVITRFICNSQETKRLALSNNPELIPENRISVIYNGFDLAGFDASDPTPMIKRKDDAVVIGTAGRLTKQKGQKILIDAASILRQRGKDYRYLIAGIGPMESELREYVQAKGVSDIVEFTGFAQNMRAFHNSLDIFALPSLWEGFGYVLTEAMAAGKPIVAFDTSSNPEVVLNNQNGLLAETADAADLAEKLEKLAEDKELRQRFGATGRTMVESRFSMDQAFSELKALL